MYSNLSDDFKETMMLPSQIKRLSGTIDGAPISSKNILQESTKIANQCSDNNDIMIGQVYVGQLNITLRGLNIPKGSYKGREIILYEGLEIDHERGIYEDVLLGHFFIDKPEWTFNGVECVCYDAMNNFDKSMSLSMTEGKIYDFVELACRRCHVTLGMTQQQIEALPNGNITLEVYKENDMSTYRDLISWCAQTTATNATINRDGELILKAYNVDVVYSFTAKDRLGTNSKYSDFSSFYTGISMVNIDAQVTKYYGLNPDNGLTMNLGSNPLLQPIEGETEQELETKRRRILNAISIINYTPFKASIHRPLVFDLMDAIQISGGLIGNEDVLSCITKYDWSFIKGYNISCSGSDPQLASAKSKTDKNLSGLMSSTTEVKNEINEVNTIVQQQSVDISGKQNKINLEIIAPDYDADECDLVFEGIIGDARKKLWRREGEQWINIQLGANVSYGMDEPTGGEDGDVYIQLSSDLKISYVSADQAWTHERFIYDDSKVAGMVISGHGTGGNDIIAYKLTGLVPDTEVTINFTAQITSGSPVYYNRYPNGAYADNVVSTSSSNYVAFTQGTDAHNYSLSFTPSDSVAYFWIQLADINDSYTITLDITNLTFQGIIGGSGIKALWVNENGTWQSGYFGGSGGDVFVGATASQAGAKGLVPAPSAGDQNKYLRGDGTWHTAGGGGGGTYSKTLLFTSGSTTTGAALNTDINLNDSITNYDQLMIVYGTAGDQGISLNFRTTFVDTELCIDFPQGYVWADYYTRWTWITFPSNSSFNYRSFGEAGNQAPLIFRIYGINY